MALDVTARRFGRLLVLENLHYGRWRCRCDCGEEVTRSWTTLRDAKTPSCGCHKRDRMRTLQPPSGPAHHRWKGGVGHRAQDLRERGTTTTQYRRWQRLVRRSSAGLCICCGVLPHDPKELECHHVHSVDHRPDLLLDPLNGVALFRPCHQAFHQAHGFGGNTPEQLQAWLETRRL